MIFYLALHQHIFQVHLNVSSNLFIKHFSHKSLASDTHILQPEGHGLAAKQPLTSDERNLLLVRLIHIDLIVSEKGIYKAKELMRNH